MKFWYLFFIFFISFSLFSQIENKVESDTLKNNSLIIDHSKDQPKATISQYRIITLERDTTFVDTSLTIKKEYEYNYLRRDIFGLMPFANEGQTYTTLQYGLNKTSSFPEFGYTAKQFNYLKANQINYYSVATPFTELYFKTVMEQGQNVDAFVTLNTSERFNFSMAYKGLRSLGKYINQLSSTGNFRFTTSYNTKNKRYYSNFHFTSQDILNGENGGITSPENFESEDVAYKERARLGVYLKDAKTTLIGKRLFHDHSFQINPTKGNNNLYLTHQINFESYYFEFNQVTIPTTIISNTGVATTFNRFGSSFVTGNINDQVRYNRIYNKIGAIYENTSLGKFQFFLDDFRYNYYYNSVLYLTSGIVPNAINDKINDFGGQYEYRKNKWTGKFRYSSSITKQSLFDFNANLKYQYNDKNSLSFEYQNSNKLPNNIYNLHQSSYITYNWYNNFKNEKSNTIKVEASTQWANATLQLNTLNDYLYFSNGDTPNLQLVSPKQYDKTINYVSLKINKEFKFRKFALDNTALYQKVDQKDNVLNVPQLVLRNTFYYSDDFFKKAMFLQTGITFNYFTKFYANDYNPILGEFFVQNQTQIGAFPNFDIFVNARIQRTRIYFKAEHFNSAMSGNNFYSAPNNPYHDFMIRFGLVWNFFQ
ncbi:MAG: hypothetical protein EXR18_03515 [Flavobacteriaceae bacterium]|nr:hypothetical protein [Flavobacteriaceae bacterium]